MLRSVIVCFLTPIPIWSMLVAKISCFSFFESQSVFMESKDLLPSNQSQRVFRARLKILQPGLISHITQRAAGKELLFIDKGDYLYMLGLFKDVAEKFDINFYAFCLMQNHLHILIEPQKENLAEAMHSIFSRYAARFNRKYARRGHLFGGPYRQAVCLDDPYFLTASVYIHLNPVRAGLSKDAQSYQWSSCLIYGPKFSAASFIDPGPVLRLLDENEEIARKHYELILAEGSSSESENILEQEGAIEKFCVRLASLFPGLFGRIRTRKKNKSKDELVDIVSLDELLHKVRSDSSQMPETRKAKRYLAQQLMARGFTGKEIARKLGVSRKTVYNLLNFEPDSKKLPISDLARFE